MLRKQFTVVSVFGIGCGGYGDHRTGGTGAGRRVPPLPCSAGIDDGADGVAAVGIAAPAVPICSPG
jgi:hypothetical protein